jgi:hypothetical protein
MRRHVVGNRGWVSAVVLTLAFTGGTARAGWAERLFSEQGHDFGPVPRGVKVRHSFVLTNQLGEPVSIADVRASCGCTTGRASASLVPPGGTATVEAEMDTRNFVGKKATVLYVTLVNAGGREAEVRLGVTSTILSDIVLNPGTIDFGPVARGQSATQHLTVERIGMPSWKVQRIVSACRAIDATLTETARDGRAVGYRLEVALRPDAPNGTLRDEIQFVTNDPETPAFPIQVTASVRGDLSASPGLLALGHVTSAGGVQGKFLVRASRPFTVRSIEGDGDGFSAKPDDPSPRSVHLVTVSYRPDEGKSRGDLRRVFRLHTDLVGEPPLELTATLHVEP